MHHIKRIIAIDHRDCGAAKLAYGDASIATPQHKPRRIAGRWQNSDAESRIDTRNSQSKPV